MSKPKEMMMVVLCMLSELGLFYQFVVVKRFCNTYG